MKATIKPSLKAFPVICLIITSYVVIAVMMGELIMGLFMVAPWWLYLKLRTNHTYTLDGDMLTHTSLLTGRTSSIDLNHVVELVVKPIAFGTGHGYLYLNSGRVFKIKNVQLNMIDHIE